MYVSSFVFIHVRVGIHFGMYPGYSSSFIGWLTLRPSPAFVQFSGRQDPDPLLRA